MGDFGIAKGNYNTYNPTIQVKNASTSNANKNKPNKIAEIQAEIKEATGQTVTEDKLEKFLESMGNSYFQNIKASNLKANRDMDKSYEEQLGKKAVLLTKEEQLEKLKELGIDPEKDGYETAIGDNDTVSFKKSTDNGVEYIRVSKDDDGNYQIYQTTIPNDGGKAKTVVFNFETAQNSAEQIEKNKHINQINKDIAYLAEKTTDADRQVHINSILANIAEINLDSSEKMEIINNLEIALFKSYNASNGIKPGEIAPPNIQEKIAKSSKEAAPMFFDTAEKIMDSSIDEISDFKNNFIAIANGEEGTKVIDKEISYAKDLLAVAEREGDEDAQKAINDKLDYFETMLIKAKGINQENTIAESEDDKIEETSTGE